MFKFEHRRASRTPLTAAMVLLFWSSQINADPQQKGDYAFWSEMPEAAQVIKDVQGKDEMDTAARRLAAYRLLERLVSKNADRVGQIPWPPREVALNKAYAGLINEYPDATLSKVEAQTELYDADRAFTRPLLQRYFSQGALREIEPIVSSFEVNARRHMDRKAQEEASIRKSEAQMHANIIAAERARSRSDYLIDDYRVPELLLAVLLLVLAPIAKTIISGKTMGYTVRAGKISALTHATETSGEIHTSAIGNRTTGQIRTRHVWSFRIDGRPASWNASGMATLNEGDLITVVGKEKESGFMIDGLRDDTTGAIYIGSPTRQYVAGAFFLLISLPLFIWADWGLVFGVMFMLPGALFWNSGRHVSTQNTMLRTAPPAAQPPIQPAPASQ